MATTVELSTSIFQATPGSWPTPRVREPPETQTTSEKETTTPRKRASPPPRGIGTLFILRGSGLSTMPSLRFISRTSGVRTSVRTSASTNTTR